ncbi:unnamed protein product, partial [Mesorhabditis belari]|uniref:Saposin B-type domain-containing protein n=1 Tax=Mesorhabditis belari TaxID=2138241 RepID=A0AAF3EYV6_9BILA
MKFLVLAVASLAIVYAQTTYRPVEPCSLCEYVTNQALHHLNFGYNEAELQKELLSDCESLQKVYGPQAVQDCKDGVNANIDIIYKDLKSGKDAWGVCVDLGQCIPSTGTHPSSHHPNFVRKH